MSTRDAIDEIVDWQLRKRSSGRGPAVCRSMLSVLDNEELEIYKSARWAPNRGWLPVDEECEDE